MTDWIWHHLPHHHHMRYTEMSELYVSLSLRSLALGVGGVFAPVYLYDIGYPLALIAVFYLISTLGRYVTEPIAGYSISRIGPKHSMGVSYGCLFLFFLALYFVPYGSWFFYAAAVLLAFEMSLFWSSYHVHLSANRNRKKGTVQVSTALILKRLCMSVGPLIGGVVAVTFGPQYILLTAASFLLLAVYPLLQTPDIRHDLRFSLRQFRLLNFWRPDVLAQTGWQFSITASMYLWPLYLFLILRAYDEVGLVLTVAIIVGTGLMYFTGRLGDRGMNEALLRIGAAVKATAHLLRAASQGFFTGLGATITNDIGDSFVSGPFAEKYYEQADRARNRLEYILAFNLIGATAKAVPWLLIILLSLAFSIQAVLVTMFVTASFLSLLIPLIARRASPQK